MHPHLYLKIRAFRATQSHSSCYSRISCHYCLHKPFVQFQLTQGPPHNLPWDSVKGLFQIHESHPKFFFLFQVSFLQLTHNEHCICISTPSSKAKLKTFNPTLCPTPIS